MPEQDAPEQQGAREQQGAPELTAALPTVRIDQLIGNGAPERPALTFRDETLTYSELAASVARAAAGLVSLGLRRGERVAVFAEKRIETVVAMLAVSAAGGVFVPVNPLFKARHLGYVLADCRPRLVVTTTERVTVLAEALAEQDGVETVVLIGTESASQAERPAPRPVVGWQSLLERLATAPNPGTIDADLAAIFYTSGSTGGPKGVMLSHRNLLVGAESVAGYLGQRADDVVLAALPVTFDAGFSQLTISFTAGAHVVLMNYLLPRDVIRLCARHRVTALTCVPPLWMQLVAQSWPAEVGANLRYFANTGGRMPRATLTRLRAIFPNAAPYLMYGLTEAFRSTYLDPAEVDNRPDSIGKAIPNAEILVLRPDGSPCDPGEHGELVHRGALVSMGYYNDPQRTAERFRPLAPVDGAVLPELAVFSGDTVYRDEDGFLYFVGRTDDMIKTAGFRISPTEIEEAGYATGLVEEVVALGVGDERLGHRVVLAVAGAAGEEPLRKALAEELPVYMMPDRIVVLDSLPRSPNGKFDRVRIRELVGDPA